MIFDDVHSCQEMCLKTFLFITVCIYCTKHVRKSMRSWIYSLGFSRTLCMEEIVRKCLILALCASKLTVQNTSLRIPFQKTMWDRGSMIFDVVQPCWGNCSKMSQVDILPKLIKKCPSVAQNSSFEPLHLENSIKLWFHGLSCGPTLSSPLDIPLYHDDKKQYCAVDP